MAAATRRPLELSCEIARAAQGEKKGTQEGIGSPGSVSVHFGLEFSYLSQKRIPLTETNTLWMAPSVSTSEAETAVCYLLCTKSVAAWQVWRSNDALAEGRKLPGCRRMSTRISPTNFRGEFWYSSLRGHSTSETNHS